MTDLELYQGDPLARARHWANLSDGDLKRRATNAAATKDEDELWSLTEAHLRLHGSAGATLSRHTVRTYRRGMLDLLGIWDSENLLRPKRDAGALFLRTLEDKGLKPATMRVKLAAAKALYRALRWSGATRVVPFTDLSPVADPTAPWDKVQPYSEKELQRLLWAADSIDKLLLLLGAHAGLRVSEMLTLDWNHIDLTGRRLIVAVGKGRKERQVVISRSLLGKLEDCSPKEGFVLPFRTQANAYRRLERLCRWAGVPNRGVHALRHTAGTRLTREADGNLEPAARHLGHATLETTRIYAKWSDDLLEGTVGEW